MKVKLVICLCLVAFLTIGCGCNNKTSKEKKDDIGFSANFNISNDQEVDGLKITNVSMIIDKNGKSSYSAIVKNNTDEAYSLTNIKATFKNKDGNTIETLVGYIGPSLNPDESQSLTLNTDKDLTNAYTVEYEIKK